MVLLDIVFQLVRSNLACNREFRMLQKLIG